MAIDLHISSDAECPTPPKLRFESMGDIRRASKIFREDFRNVEARLALDSYRQYRLACIRTSLFLLRRASLPGRVLVSARLKRLESTHRKMMRCLDQPMLVHEMDDIIGFRIVCESFDEAVALGQRIASNVPARTKDYIQNVHGAGVGYRAIHGIAKFQQPLLDGHVTVRFEIQIRTWYQHLWACWCESHGEQAKEGFTNKERSDREAVEAMKHKLIDCSRAVARWEEVHRGRLQQRLPPFVDPYNLAVAWVDPPEQYGFYPCGTDIATAVKRLRYHESQRGLQPLLLVGVADSPELKGVLTRTHPNFVGGQSLDPQDWMPG